jgi:hypothetical protein
MTEFDRHLTELATQAKYDRRRYELYKAKTYGPRATSPGRLRELKRASDISQRRLARAAASDISQRRLARAAQAGS